LVKIKYSGCLKSVLCTGFYLPGKSSNNIRPEMLKAGNVRGAIF
jgi:hypothetical protein